MRSRSKRKIEQECCETTEPKSKKARLVKKARENGYAAKRERILQPLPAMLGTWSVLFAVRAQTPCGGKPSTWYAKLQNLEDASVLSAVIKGPVMATKHVDTQIFIDAVKPFFGIEQIGTFRVDAEQGVFLVSRDRGYGDPENYPTKLSGAKTLKGLVIVDKTKTGAQMLRTWLETNTPAPAVMQDILFTLSFRWMLGIGDTNCNNILFLDVPHRVLSVDENDLFVRNNAAPSSLVDCLFNQRPPAKLVVSLEQFVRDNKEKCLSILQEWKIKLADQSLIEVFQKYGYDHSEVAPRMEANLDHLIHVLQRNC